MNQYVDHSRTHRFRALSLRWAFSKPWLSCVAVLTIGAYLSADPLEFDIQDVGDTWVGIGLATGDVDGDGDSDIVATSFFDEACSILWLSNNGAVHPSFTTHVIETSMSGIMDIRALDLDLDGDLDIVAAEGHNAVPIGSLPSKIMWYENDGGFTPAFTEHQIAEDPLGVFHLYVADVDGDGDTDVLSTSFGDDTIAWFQNVGSNSLVFVEHIISESVDDPSGIHAVDLDDDADTDVIVVSAADGSVRWFESDGQALPAYTEHAVWDGTYVGFDVNAGGSESRWRFRHSRRLRTFSGVVRKQWLGATHLHNACFIAACPVVGHLDCQR
jgi:hypothetical protein